jgi:hypothetical protein
MRDNIQFLFLIFRRSAYNLQAKTYRHVNIAAVHMEAKFCHSEGRKYTKIFFVTLKVERTLKCRYIEVNFS